MTRPREISNENLAALNDYFVRGKEDVVALTRALVEAESPSGDVAGSKSVVSLLVSAAAETVGVTDIERVSSENYGEHLRLNAFFGSPDIKPILILGHTDTVHPRGSLQQRPWRVERGKAYGPGVFDMKANCALAIEIIRALSEAGLKSRPVVLLLACDEETGSLTGRQLIEAEASRAQAVLVLEPPGNCGRVKTGRKGTGIY